MGRRGGPDQDDGGAITPIAPARRPAAPKPEQGGKHEKSPSPIAGRGGGNSQSDITKRDDDHRLSIADSTGGPGAPRSTAPATLPTERETTAATRSSRSSRPRALSGLSDEEAPIMATVVNHQEEHAPSAEKDALPWSALLRDRKVQCLLIVCVLIIAGLAVGLVMVMASDDSAGSKAASENALAGSDTTSPVAPPSPSPTLPPTMSPSLSPTWTNQAIMNFMVSKASTPLSSAAEKSMKWVHDDPLLNTYDNDRILQRFALGTFYFEVQEHGPPYIFENELDTIADECAWTGIECWGGPDVKNVDFNSILIKGTFPPELGLITTMEWFVMWSNKFYGEIPHEFTAWTNLEGLYIGGNDFTGTIPSNLFLLTTLEYVSFDWNGFQGTFPTELQNLPNLVQVDMGHLNLSGPIPSFIYELTNLERLNIQSLGLTGTLSTKIGQLTNLRNLVVGDNNFVGNLPTELGLLSLLTEFDAFKNTFVGTIPTELAQLSELELFDLSTNQLTGTIPMTEQSFYANIYKWFGLANNQLTGTIPTQLGQLQFVNSGIELDHNLLTGTIPSELGKLTLSTTLRLNNNQLSGGIPSELGNLVNVRELSLHHNPGLTGMIPVQLGNLTSVETLAIYDNALTGVVPSEICALTTSGSLTLVTVNCLVPCGCCGEYCF